MAYTTRKYPPLHNTWRSAESMYNSGVRFGLVSSAYTYEAWHTGYETRVLPYEVGANGYSVELVHDVLSVGEHVIYMPPQTISGVTGTFRSVVFYMYALGSPPLYTGHFPLLVQVDLGADVTLAGEPWALKLEDDILVRWSV